MYLNKKLSVTVLFPVYFSLKKKRYTKDFYYDCDFLL